MQFRHECSLDWMKARQKYLTASDIKDLLPFTATGRPRKITDQDRLKVYSRKLKVLTQDDCISTGAAARGHMLEPYAIETSNYHIVSKYFHWDDALIYNEDLMLAFSPDGCNIPQHYDEGVEIINDHVEELTSIIEVKSYNPERHMSIANTPYEKIEERWQIATAMAVCQNINSGVLVLFNPDLPKNAMAYVRYIRGDLRDEIKTIEHIAEDYHDFVVKMKAGFSIRPFYRLDTKEFWKKFEEDHMDSVINP